MSTSIVFPRDMCPAFQVNGRTVGIITQIDLDLSGAAIAVEKVHVEPTHVNKLRGPTPNNPGVPEHPFIKVVE